MSWRLILKLCRIKKKVTQNVSKTRMQLHPICLLKHSQPTQHRVNVLNVQHRFGADICSLQPWNALTPKGTSCQRPQTERGSSHTWYKVPKTHQCVCAQLELTDTPGCSKQWNPSRAKCFCCPVSQADEQHSLTQDTKGRAHCTVPWLFSLPAQPRTTLTWSFWLSCFKSPLHYWSIKKNKDTTLDTVHYEEIMLKRPSFNPHTEFST